MEITYMIVLALFIEAIVQVTKPIWARWEKEERVISITECVSMAIGVLMAVLLKFNFLAGLIESTNAILVYALYVLSGIAIGRGPSFVHDLWTKLRSYIIKE